MRVAPEAPLSSFLDLWGIEDRNDASFMETMNLLPMRPMTPASRRPLRSVRRLLSCLFLGLAAGWVGTGWPDLGPVRGDDHPVASRHGYPTAIAIKDARIVAAPGKIHDPGTVVVRSGVIEAVGPSKETAIPFDSELIEGKGLVIYPGFIDLFTTVGQRPGVDRSATGRGRPDAAPPQQGPARRRLAPDQGATENPYPRVLMGSVAHLRQAMLDAERQHSLELDQGSYEVRAPYDPTLRALWLARDRKLTVWWEADTRDEIHRALDLAEEFGTTAVIVGGREAAKVVDRLKAQRIAVILRLNAPEEPKVPTEDEFRKRPLLEQDEPLKLLAHRKERWKERMAMAGWP